MVSEDSDEFVPGLLPVHRLCDLRDLDEAVGGQMPAGGDELDAASELLEVLLLRAPHRMLSEERDNRLQQGGTLPNHVSLQVLAVVVVPLVGEHLPDSEELTKVMETVDAGGTLCHREFMSHLETGCVAFSTRTAWLPYEADREASFSVYETDHPATELDQSFLLIVRTRHVVTMVNVQSDVTR